MTNDKQMNPDAQPEVEETQVPAEKPRLELKIEKVSLKTGLRGGIHDADKACAAY